MLPNTFNKVNKFKRIVKCYHYINRYRKWIRHHTLLRYDVCQGLQSSPCELNMLTVLDTLVVNITVQDVTLGFYYKGRWCNHRTPILISQQTWSILWDDKQDSPFKDDRRLDDWSWKCRQRWKRTISSSEFISHRQIQFTIIRYKWNTCNRDQMISLLLSVLQLLLSN